MKGAENDDFQKVTRFLKQELKRSLDLLIATVKAPRTEVVRERALSWTQIVFIFLLFSFAHQFVTTMISAPFSFASIWLAGFVLVSAVWAFILVGGVWLILKVADKEVDFRSLAESALVAWVFTSVVSVPLSLLPIFTSVLWMSWLIALPAIVLLLVFFYLFWIALQERFQVSKKLASWIVGGLCILALSQPIASLFQRSQIPDVSKDIFKYMNFDPDRLPKIAEAEIEEIDTASKKSLRSLADERAGGDITKKRAIFQFAESIQQIVTKS